MRSPLLVRLVLRTAGQITTALSVNDGVSLCTYGGTPLSPKYSPPLGIYNSLPIRVQRYMPNEINSGFIVHM